MNPMIAAAAISAIGGLLSNKENVGQSQKNMDFQKEMYERQFNDSIKFWNLNNEFNSPANQLLRLTKAGLNPLLMYGQGGVSNVSTSAPQTPSQPHGAQASVVNPFDLAQYMLLDAQREKLNAETKKVESETDWQSLENKWQRESYDVRLAIQRGDYDYLQTKIQELQTNMFNSTRIASEQVQTMVQARLYEVKRFNLDSNTIGTQLEQGWENLKNGRIQANASWRSAAAAWLNAVTNANLSHWQIGEMAQGILYRSQEQPFRLKNLRLQNINNSWDAVLKKADVNNRQQEILNRTIRNNNFLRYGSEEPFHHLKDLWNFSGAVRSLFVYPWSW